MQETGRWHAKNTCIRNYWMISPGHYDVALRYFETAREIDSTYALAHVGIASVWGHYGLWGGVPPREANARVKEAISKAV